MRSDKGKKGGTKPGSPGPARTPPFIIDKVYRIPEDLDPDEVLTFTGASQAYDQHHQECIETAWVESKQVFAGQIRVTGEHLDDHYRGDLRALVANKIREVLLPVFNGTGEIDSPICGRRVVLDDGRGSIELHWDGRRVAPLAALRESETPEQIVRSHTSSADVGSFEALGTPYSKPSPIQVGCFELAFSRSNSIGGDVGRNTGDVALTLTDEPAHTNSMDCMDAPGSAKNREQLGRVELSTGELRALNLPQGHIWTTIIDVMPIPIQDANTATQHPADLNHAEGLDPTSRPAVDPISAQVYSMIEWIRDAAFACSAARLAAREGIQTLAADLDALAPVRSMETRPGKVRTTAQPESGSESQSTNYLTIAQAAHRLGMDKRNVRYYINKGALEVVEFGPHSKLIPRKSFEDFEKRYVRRKNPN